MMTEEEVEVEQKELERKAAKKVAKKAAKKAAETAVPEPLLKEYYTPMAGASDMADAIPNGCKMGIESIKEWVACWAHVWRAVHKTGLKKLNDSGEARVDMLFTDMAFLHETSVIELWPHGVRLIKD